MLVAIDSETTGVDIYKGTKAFFVTSCTQDGDQQYWEWKVDPHTRLPYIPQEDVEDVAELIRSADELILQNGKFDFGALRETNRDFIKHWDWAKVQDTLIAGHLLASNHRHNLTDMAMEYLNVDISKYEVELKQACQAAQRYVRSRLKDWRIAKAGLPEMPSAKGDSKSRDKGVQDSSPWKFDTWLPKALVQYKYERTKFDEIGVPKDILDIIKRGGIYPRGVGDVDRYPPYTGECEVVNYRYEECDEKIDRSTKWGNPFTHLPLHKTRAQYQVGSKEEAIAKYKEWILDQPDLLSSLPELEGKRLGCTCKMRKPTSPGAEISDVPCHGDVLQELLRRIRHSWWDVLAKYANCDSETTIALWMTMEEELKRRKLWKIYRTRMRLPEITSAMEDHGAAYSKVRLDELVTDFRADSDTARCVCINIAKGLGYDLDMPARSGPNQSLRTFMFDVLKVPHVINKKAKTDAPTLNAAAMEHYLTVLPSRSKALTFVKNLLAKRKRDTALAFMTNYERFAVPVHPDKDVNDQLWFKLHPSFNCTGTDTLRWSCANPNGQNIGKKGVDAPCPRCRGEGCDYCDDNGTIAYNVRYCMGPEPGREWYSCDGKNLELRIPAYRAGEQDMIGLFERPKDPPYYGSNHLLSFSAVYPDIWEQEVEEQIKNKDHIKDKFKSTWYQWCKNGNFAIQYSAGPVTADAAFHKQGAHALLKKRFAKLHGDGGLNQWCIQYAEKHGYIETIPDQSVDPARGYPLLCTRTEFGKILSTVPLSYFVQGTACWWIQMAMIRVYDFFQEINSGKVFAGKKWPGGYYINLQIHDELLMDLPNGWEMERKLKLPKSENQYEYNLPIMREVQRLMEIGGQDIGVPTPSSLEFHPVSWSEGISL